jgi:hypothetical protein
MLCDWLDLGFGLASFKFLSGDAVGLVQYLFFFACLVELL